MLMIMSREEEIIKAAREYAMNKSNENNTWFVEDKVMSKFSKKINRVHFYVARDMDGGLYLYLGKPLRGDGEFHGNNNANVFTLTGNLRSFGLNKNDYKNLHWKDEPVEVFVNMED